MPTDGERVDSAALLELREAVEALTTALRDPCFLSDNAMRQRLGIGEEKWRSSVKVLERQGFPRKDPLYGKRWWPAVKAFFDRRHGLGAAGHQSFGVDGFENLDAL